MDHLPSFKYSLDALGHLLPNKWKRNGITREDIYKQYIQFSWITPPTGLKPKMAFCAKQFMELRGSLIVQCPYAL
jgi:hypothetical protein